MINLICNHELTKSLSNLFIIKIVIFVIFFTASQTASSASYILSTPPLTQNQNTNFSNYSSALINEKKDLWLLISEPGTTPAIYYAPLSVRTVKPGFASVTNLINYTSEEGKAESLLGITVYDCAMGTKQEQSTVQYSRHWADGDVVLQIGLEEPWQPVKLGTEGMRLLKVACDVQ